ncbi:MAG TPA: hypothetical protein PLY34_14685 [Ferruginibacter sp.]|nr:hypothetical protein [Ferruginibacter sp.]HPH91530.1 hypothetical protein [Ferruginibacter sp.]
MKRLTLILLFQWVLFAFSQQETDWKNVTFKDAAFFGALNTTDNVVQKDKTGELTRILTPLEKKSPEEHFRYLLNCYNKEGIVEASQYILSKIAIPGDFDLFRVRCNSAEVLCYDYFAEKNFTIEPNRGVKMIVKVNNEEVGLNSPMDKHYEPCGNGGFSLCEDWFLVEYYEETGEIISVTPWGTTCSGCVGGGVLPGGGGGGGGNNNPPDPIACSDDEGNPVSIYEYVLYSGNSNTRYSSHAWTFIQGNGWRIKSYEKGTQVLDVNRWLFTALDHVNSNLTGTSPEFEITHTMNSAIGTPEGDPQYARMYLRYTINYICKKTSYPRTSDYNSDATWRANSSEGPWIFGPTLEN